MSSVSMSSLIVLYVGICLLVSILSLELKRYLNIPSFLTILLLGFLLEELIPSSGLFSEVIEMLLHSKPGLYRYVFLPILIFNSTYSANSYMLKKQFFQILLLSTSVLISCSALTAVSLEHIFGYTLEFRKLFMMGLILSSTDNIVFQSVTKDLHINGSLRSLIGGETMMNYANVLLVLEVLMNDYSGTQGFGNAMELFCKLIFGGIALGLAFAFGYSMVIKNILNDFVVETNFTIVSAYLLYWVCEYPKVHFSGSFALVVFGIFMAAYGKTKISPEIESRLKSFISLLASNSEAVVMMTSGIFLAKITLTKSPFLSKTDYTNLFLIFLLTYPIRALVLLVHYPLLIKTGYKIPLKELIFISLAGMKGILSVMMTSLATDDLTFTIQEQSLMRYFGIGVPLLCIAVGGLATRFSVHFLGLQKLTQAEENVLIGATCALVENTRSQMEKMKDDDEYRLADWVKVSRTVGADDLIKKIIRKTEGLKKKYAEDCDQLENMLNHHNRVTLNTQDAVLEIRKRFLSTLKGTYWERFKSGLYSGMSAFILMNSVSHCFEKVERAMDDWKYIKRHIFSEKTMKILKNYSNSPIFGKFFKKIMYKRIITMYDSATNFINCHKITEDLFYQFELDYNKKAFKSILKESHRQMNKCQKFLNRYIFDLFPEIISEVQTRQCCKLLLIEQRKTVEKIFHEGLIKEQENEQLLNAIDSSLKTITYKGTPEVPSVEEILKNRFKLASENEIQDLSSEMIEKTVPPGHVLLTEGQNNPEAFLIIRGRVREYSSWIDQELVIGNIVGVQHLIEEYSEKSTSSIVALSECVLIVIPKKIMKIQNFYADVFKEATEEIVMMNRKRYDLCQATDEHVLQVVGQSKVRVLKQGSKAKLMNGALVLNASQENQWVIQPSFERFSALNDSVLLVFPEEFLFYFEKDQNLGHAFTEFCTREKENGIFKKVNWEIKHKRKPTSDNLLDSKVE